MILLLCWSAVTAKPIKSFGDIVYMGGDMNRSIKQILRPTLAFFFVKVFGELVVELIGVVVQGFL